MKNICLIVSVVIFSFGFLSCDREKVYEEFFTLDQQKWDHKAPVLFNVNVSDTLSAHNIYVIIRNTGQYQYSNLYLFITTQAPNGNILKDTTEVILANERGKWLGTGSGAAYTLKFPYKEKIKFPAKGIYRFQIEQAMWVDNLKHISHVGLRIERSEK
jgi:gliding motility-associated lipoprotein GldH